MKIAPVHAIQIGMDFPVETGISGRFPLFIKHGYIVLKMSGVVDQPTYALLVRAFPESYDTIHAHENVILEKLTDKTLDLTSGAVINKPVCLLYQPNKIIAGLLQTGFENGRMVVRHQQAETSYEYAIFDNEEWAGQVTQTIGLLEHLVIADGHHRTAAYFRIREESHEDHGLFCALLPLDQVKVHAYHRRVMMDDAQFSEFRNFFRSYYAVRFISIEEAREIQHRLESGIDILLLYHKGKWRKLNPLSGEASRRKGSADLLLEFEELVLNPFFHHSGLLAYEQVEYVSGMELNLEDLDPERNEVILIFPPVSRQFLWQSSLKGELMPAKSTWIEPRMPSDVIQVPNNI